MITLEEARPFLQKALDLAGNTHTIEDVAAGIEEGRYQWWPGVTSAIVTQINVFPRARQLHFWLAGGRMEELAVLYPVAEAWGREMGCTVATSIARPGWIKTAWADQGWSPRPLVFYEKPLD